MEKEWLAEDLSKMSLNDLSKNEKIRYSRNILLPDFGEKKQKILKDSRVLVIGAGGLGSSALLYLAAAGVGNIGIVDFDSVELSNLNRQIIHTSNDLTSKKTLSAKQKLLALNPEINVKTYELFFDEFNQEILDDYDFVLDCTDNFVSKKLINKICINKNKPYSYSGILDYCGQTMTILPKQSVCYNCVFSGENPDSQSKAVLGIMPGVLGILQAAEAIKYFLELGELLVNKMLIYNFLENSFRVVDLQKDKDCEVCGL